MDSGASHCFVVSSLVAAAQLSVFEGEELAVTLADGSTFRSNKCVLLPLELDGKVSLGVKCRVVDTLTSPVVLGIDWLTQYSPRIDWSNYAIELDTSISTVVLTGVPSG